MSHNRGVFIKTEWVSPKGGAKFTNRVNSVRSDLIDKMTRNDANFTHIFTNDAQVCSTIGVDDITCALAFYEALLAQKQRPQSNFLWPATNDQQDVISYTLDLTGTEVSVIELLYDPAQPEKIFERRYPFAREQVSSRATIAPAAQGPALNP